MTEDSRAPEPERPERPDPPPSRLARLGDRALDVFAALVVVLMLAICLQVLASALDLNPLATFRRAWPLVGEAITLNSLLDFQWHLLVVIALLPTALVWRRDGHVRVDFLYTGFGDRGRAAVDLAGALLLTLPFLVMAVPASWSFMRRAWLSSEMSASGGLTDRWLIKAALPLGFVLLGVVVLAELPGLARRVLGPQAPGRRR